MKATENQQQQPVSLLLHHLAFCRRDHPYPISPDNTLSRLSSYSVAGTSSANKSGVFATRIPFSLHFLRSILSNPKLKKKKNSI
ncbi:hypothetical protein P8452_08931 [Trifolium repens]|nr:hypothetical protein P8452_08931 [Trifolium repens]